jgi:hypothetical protein
MFVEPLARMRDFLFVDDGNVNFAGEPWLSRLARVRRLLYPPEGSYRAHATSWWVAVLLTRRLQTSRI